MLPQCLSLEKAKGHLGGEKNKNYSSIFSNQLFALQCSFNCTTDCKSATVPVTVPAAVLQNSSKRDPHGRRKAGNPAGEGDAIHDSLDRSTGF